MMMRAGYNAWPLVAMQRLMLQPFEALWLDHQKGRLLRDGLDTPQAEGRLPFAVLPPQQAVAWLILTHHRLPCLPQQSQWQQ